MNQSKRIALILGGSSGLGLASAEKLAQAGFDLCIVHRTRKSDLDAFQEVVKQMANAGSTVNTHNLDALKKENDFRSTKNLAQGIGEIIITQYCQRKPETINWRKCINKGRYRDHCACHGT